MGVAGSGKSMQSRLLADDYGYAWISTGEILRVLITGKRRQEMLAGKLLSDMEMITVIDKVLDLIDTNQDFVLDGFPRTVPQTDWLVDQVRQKRLNLKAIVHLVAPEEIVHQRLKERGRLDDTDQAIAKRFNEYKTVTLPIINRFRQDNIHVYDVDAAQEPREVHKAIMRIINEDKAIKSL